MIILLLSGGLGNQMFAYAFGKSLSERYGEKIYISTYGFIKDKQRSFSMAQYNLMKHARVLNKFEQIFFYFVKKMREQKLNKVYGEKLSHHGFESYKTYAESGIYSNYDFYIFYPFVKAKKRIKYVEMGWQSEKYFTNVKSSLERDFETYRSINSDCEKMLAQIQKNNSVCLHIRRGDYTTKENASIFGVCSEEYYTKAIAVMERKVSEPSFYVFTNSSEDTIWIKNHYKLPSKTIFVDIIADDWMHFELMRNCKHFILSNSSFSWWASYLARNKEKIIISPDRWILNQSDKDIFCDNWIRLNEKGKEVNGETK